MRIRELKVLSDERTVQSKPEGWEWDDRPVTRPSHIKEIQEDPGWESGVNILKKQDGTEEKFVLALEDLETKEVDWSML